MRHREGRRGGPGAEIAEPPETEPGDQARGQDKDYRDGDRNNCFPVCCPDGSSGYMESGCFTMRDGVISTTQASTHPGL